MSFICKFLHENDSVGKRLHKKIPKNIFQYDRFYCVCNIGNRHWAVLTVNFLQKTIKYMDSLSCKGTKYISSIMHWIDYEHMKFDNKKLIWDEWKVSNPFTRCTTQTNGYDCGVYAIKYIDFDSLDASLMFPKKMVQYREFLQYSICTLTYNFLGVNEVDVPNIDSIPDQLNDEIANVHIGNIEQIQHDETKLNEGDISKISSLSNFMSVDSKCDMKMMAHNVLEISSTTLLTCKNNGMRFSVYQYVESSLHYFHTNKEHNDWYITPLKSILDKKVDRHMILEIGNRTTYINNPTNNESKLNDVK